MGCLPIPVGEDAQAVPLTARQGVVVLPTTSGWTTHLGEEPAPSLYPGTHHSLLIGSGGGL